MLYSWSLAELAPPVALSARDQRSRPQRIHASPITIRSGRRRARRRRRTRPWRRGRPARRSCRRRRGCSGCWTRRGCFARHQQLRVVHKHPSEIAESVLMRQEFNAHGLSCERCHVHCLVDPRLGIKALMEDRLQDVAITIGNVCILPIKRNAVGRAVPVPEA